MYVARSVATRLMYVGSYKVEVMRGDGVIVVVVWSRSVVETDADADTNAEC